MKTILITGASGFLGSQLRRELVDKGFQVIGVDQKDDSAESVIGIDLLSTTARDALRRLPCPDCIVHLAALAHNQRPPAGQTCLQVNTQMTQVLLDVFEGQCIQFVFSSSVAVYGEAERSLIIPPDVSLRPASEYGESKRKCEQMLAESRVPNIDIIRFAPIYSDNCLQDVAKRVYLPGCTTIRMMMFPSPNYSLCHIETAVKYLVARVQQGGQGRTVCNVLDRDSYSQKQLMKWFNGPILPIPTGCFRPVLWVLRKMHSPRVYATRCNLEKLFFTHLYSDGKVLIH